MEILLGVSGGIAAYKAADLTSSLVKRGHRVRVVMTESAELIEVQGTAEAGAFNRKELNAMLDLAEKAGDELREKQREALGIRG